MSAEEPPEEGVLGVIFIYSEVFTMNKKICSILLSLAMTVSVLSTFYGTVAADTVDNQEPGTVETTAPETEQKPDEQKDPEQKPDEQGEPEQKSDEQADPNQKADPEAEQQPETQQDTAPKKKADVRGVSGTRGANSGEFGNGLTWQFTQSTGELCISGTGAMPDYDPSSSQLTLSDRPWNDLIDSITLITIENGITSVGSYAFSGCTNATEVIFNEDIKIIGKRAFENCGFTSMYLPDYLDTIGEGAFNGCSSLKGALVIPYTVSEIGDAAFGNCSLITYAYLPDYITSINENLFIDCTKLKEVSISYGVEEIKDGAFSGCTALTEIYMPRTVTSIERCAFMNSGLTEVVIPDQVTKISSQTFSGCSNLRTVTIPDSVTTIEADAFSSCNSLQTITIPSSVTTISAGAFRYCIGLSTIYCQINPGNLTWGASSSDFMENKGTKCYVSNRYLSDYEENFSDINVTFEAKVYGSGSCGDNASWVLDIDGTMTISGTGPMESYADEYSVPWQDYKSKITNLIIEDGITTIGDWSFNDCEYLSSVTLPDSITIIGARAFSDTDRLRSIVLPANLDTIGEYAFRGSKIESIVIPDSVTTIGRGAFLDASEMKSLTIGANVRNIDLEAFASSAIESVVIPDGVTSIGESVFQSCSQLASVTIPNSVTVIDKQAFFNCGMLKNITLPQNLETIGENAFNSCYGLESITIPGSVKNFGIGAFRDCEALTSVTIGKGIKTIPEDAFRDCPKLKNVTIPNTVTLIESLAFCVYSYPGYGSIEELTLPDSVYRIGANAFHGQSIRSITIPGSIGYIDGETFSSCNNLETVIILNGVTTIYRDAFKDCNNIKTVSVPSSVTEIEDTAPFGEGQNLKDIYSFTGPDAWINFSYGSSYNDSTKLHVPEDMVDSYRSTLNPDSTLISANNLIGDAVGEAAINTGAGVHLYGYTLSLAGDIGVNFWFKLDEANNGDDNYIKFTVNDKEQIVKVSEAANGTNGYKIFRCGVAAKEMTDTITAQFYLSNGMPVGIPYTYSVREYAEYIRNHGEYSRTTKDLITAMLNYGACSQIYFNYKTDSLANSSLEDFEIYVGISTPNQIDFTTEGPGYMKPARVSLLLKSTVTLKLYFDASEAAGKVFKFGNEVLPAVKSGQYIVVSVEGITALQLCSDVSVGVYENDTLLGNVKYCPAKYIKIVLSQESDGDVITDDLKRVVSALYDFSWCAEAYRIDNGN